MKQFIILLLFLTPVLTKCQQQKPKHNLKAFSLNQKAFKLLITKGVKEKLTDGELSVKVIRILDSATVIEPSYTSAYTNKLSSLIYLKRYKEAIANLNKAILSDPEAYEHYLKLGILYKDYLLDKPKAKMAFGKSYTLALNKANSDKHTKVNYDTNVAFVLAFAKNKNEAFKYLDKISVYYKNDKDLNQISYFRKLLLNEVFDQRTGSKIFDNYSTL
jgi:tetratricopeptide (TPR) repeat protein